MPTVGIIGSSQDSSFGEKFTPTLYEAMVARAYNIITEEFDLNPSSVTLVSGGAAWGDHVAVTLKERYPEFQGLDLYLPTSLGEKGFAGYSGTAKMANERHGHMTRVVKRDTYQELRKALFHGQARVFTYPGFKPRNDAIAKESNYAIAFTWGEHSPETPGTKYTWGKFPEGCKKVHVSLKSLL